MSLFGQQALKPEHEIQGKHEIPEWAQHNDSFTYIIQDAPNVWFLGHHQESNNSMIGSVTVIQENVCYLRVCRLPKDPTKRMLFRLDVVQWLMKEGIKSVTNMTSEKFFDELKQHFPQAIKTGRWMQFGKNPLIEGVCEIRR